MRLNAIFLEWSISSAYDYATNKVVYEAQKPGETVILKADTLDDILKLIRIREGKSNE